MRKSLFISLLSVILFSVCSCSNKQSGIENQDMITIDVPLQPDWSTPLPRVSDLFQITNVELSASSLESLVGSVSEIKLYGDTLYILSDVSLYLFKTDGRFITRINKEGRGRGEYVNITEFEIDRKNNNLLIFDRSTGMLRYTMDGKFIDKTPIKGMPQEFALLPGGDYLFYSPYDIDGLKGLWVTDSKDNFKRQLLGLKDYKQQVVTADYKLACINDSLVGFMGPEKADLFYHITDDTIVTAYHITSHFSSAGVTEGVGEEQVELPSYTKSYYCESDELFMFVMVGITDGVAIRTIYDKRTGQVMHPFAANSKAASDPEYKYPNFVNGYKNYFFNTISVKSILNNERLKAQYPDITEESNPVIQIFRAK